MDCSTILHDKEHTIAQGMHQVGILLETCTSSNDGHFYSPLKLPPKIFLSISHVSKFAESFLLVFIEILTDREIYLCPIRMQISFSQLLLFKNCLTSLMHTLLKFSVVDLLFCMDHSGSLSSSSLAGDTTSSQFYEPI